MTRLQGKTAIVTGAASGIGRAVALRFAAEGAWVALFDVNVEGLAQTHAMISAAGGQASPFHCNVADSASVQAAIGAAITAYESFQIVFNGVGLSGRQWGDGPIHECTEDAWERVLAINLTSMFLMCKYTVPHLLAQGGGSIINLSSVLALVGGDADFFTHAYAASKSGIIGMSRGMAAYYAPQSLRVNVIAAGLIATPMSQRAQQNPHILGRLKDLQPLTGAMGEASDVAGAAAYLASDDSRFVTGVVLPVDGGWTAH